MGSLNKNKFKEKTSKVAQFIISLFKKRKEISLGPHNKYTGFLSVVVNLFKEWGKPLLGSWQVLEKGLRALFVLETRTRHSWLLEVHTVSSVGG